MATLLKKEDGVINWSLSAQSIANRVRGLSPWPGAYTFLGHDRWNIWSAVAKPVRRDEQPGTIIAVTKHSIQVVTGYGLLELVEIQTANSKRMTAAQYLAGHRVGVGARLGPGVC